MTASERTMERPRAHRCAAARDDFEVHLRQEPEGLLTTAERGSTVGAGGKRSFEL